MISKPEEWKPIKLDFITSNQCYFQDERKEVVVIRHCRRCSLIFFLPVLLLFICGMTAEAISKEILSFSEPLKPLSKQIDWKIEPTRAGLQSTVFLKLSLPNKPEGMQGKMVGEYRIDIDGMILKQEVFEQPVAKLESILPFDRISNGEHTILLEVRGFDGKVSSQKRTFILNAQPAMEIVIPRQDDDVFDPVLSFSLWGDLDGISGMVDIFLDEKPIHSFPLKKEQNTKKYPLSELLGKRLYRADLQPGSHWLKIVVHAINGSFANFTLPIDVPARKATVTVKRDAKKVIECLDIQFPESENAVKGSVDIYSRQAVVLSASAKNLKVTISHDDIQAALKRNKQLGNGAISLVIATRTANQVEDWQDISFQP